MSKTPEYKPLVGKKINKPTEEDIKLLLEQMSIEECMSYIAKSVIVKEEKIKGNT